MNTYSENDQLKLFKSLFKGREDVFAVRWEKGNKSGYMPAYSFDPYAFRLHKVKGGAFNDYKEKAYLPLTDQQLVKHFNGLQQVGIYPLLHDNTSWFIAADFDKANWADECKAFINICREYGIPAYLERSRSGKGGHVWIFFDSPFPAVRSRKVFMHFLELAGGCSVFDKNSSFDRLFPNQDFHSGRGLGNLIALPFFKPALLAGNCCFIDDQLEPYKNQWEFLSSIKRFSASHIDLLYTSLQTYNTRVQPITSNKLHIQLKNEVHLNRSGITPELTGFLKEELNFSNSQYLAKKKSGRNTWGTERYFRMIKEMENDVVIPRGFIGNLLRYCKHENIEFEFQDERKKHEAVRFKTEITLREHQKSATEAASRKEFGVISAPPGSGKTVIGLKIIVDKQQPALIIVHRKQLLEQWIERVQAFLEIPLNEIGRIGQGHSKSGKLITVAMIQSLSKHLEKQGTDDFAHSFGTIIVDECHHIPAETYRNTFSKLFPYYQYGLTATPFRKGNDEKLIFIHLGEVIAEIKPEAIEQYKYARVIVRETTLDIPFNPKTDMFETLSKVLVHDTTRNKLILADITSELNKGKKVVIITERKEHIDSLHIFLKQSFEVVTLSGEDSESARKTKWKALNSGNYQALITTGQFFGEGTDLQNASCLFLVYPFSFKGKLIQYVGRVQRCEITPTIYDYRDRKIEYLNRLFLKRNTYYRHLSKQASLFDDAVTAESPSEKTKVIDKSIKVSIDQLDFRYGAIAFAYIVSEMNMELVFEIENNEVRPEFDVLKPYFSKVLNSNSVNVKIFAEFENGLLVSQICNSLELERINRDIIESVKFRYIEQDILGKHHNTSEENLLDLNKVQQGQNERNLYSSEEEILNDILKNDKVKHFKHLRHLASKHESSILKLRFVLNPFSFVFLISGTENYHVILETLDTEEATYVWHVEKNLQSLKEKLRSIDNDLNLIRNMGRQHFLTNQPQNFSKLIHDYSEERKGFIIWKDQLEEKLY